MAIHLIALDRAETNQECIINNLEERKVVAKTMTYFCNAATFVSLVRNGRTSLTG